MAFLDWRTLIPLTMCMLTSQDIASPVRVEMNNEHPLNGINYIEPWRQLCISYVNPPNSQFFLRRPFVATILHRAVDTDLFHTREYRSWEYSTRQNVGHLRCVIIGDCVHKCRAGGGRGGGGGGGGGGALSCILFSEYRTQKLRRDYFRCWHQWQADEW